MKEKILVLYAFHEYNIRVINFINNAIFKDDNIDFVLISNDRNINFTCPEYVKKVYRDNIGFDFGGWSDVLLHDNFYQNYDYFIFSNSSVKGPYLKNKNDKWTDKFIEPLNRYHLFGSFRNTEIIEHVQSYIYSMKKKTLEYLITNGIFDNMKYSMTYKEAVHEKEVRMSQLIVSKKWKLDSLFPIYYKPHLMKHNTNDLYKCVFVKGRVDPYGIYNMAFGNPCPDKSKKFYIKYKNVNNHILDMSLNEDQQNKLDSPQKIIKATYGNIDVTNKCNLPLNNNNELKYINNLNISIPYIEFLNDPFPNNFKTLVIEYVDIYNNISKQFYRENTNIDLNYNNIIKCTYGYKSNWIDVTQIILKFSKIDNINIININIQINKIKTLSIKNIDYNNLFGDPCIDQPKLLTVKYKHINNKLCENKFNENQNFTLNYKQIVSAFYGNNNKKTDVTNKILDFIDKNTDTDTDTNTDTNIKTNTDTDKNNNKLSFQFVNYNNLFGDPCIDQPKLLTVKYKHINNKICENKFNENQNFTLNYKQIVSAFYGNNNKKTDVTNIILDFTKYNNYLFIDKTKYNNLFGDPCINQFKLLTVKYKNINDQICINIFNENENFTLNYKQIVSASYGNKKYKKNIIKKLI